MPSLLGVVLLLLSTGRGYGLMIRQWRLQIPDATHFGGCAACAFALSVAPMEAHAVKDCFQDCSENCNRLAPQSRSYCTRSCNDYCEQDDREDGLSGSVGSSGAEIGWRSGFDALSRAQGKISAVPYGEDRPPSLPDPFNVGPMLKKSTQGKGQ